MGEKGKASIMGEEIEKGKEGIYRQGGFKCNQDNPQITFTELNPRNYRSREGHR